MRNTFQQVGSDRGIFYGFLALVIWAPLPLASNRPWLWSLLGVLVFSLALWWLVNFLRGKVQLTTGFLQARLSIAVCLLWLALLLFQLLASLTVAPYVSSDFLLRSCALVTFFILSLLLLRSRKRLKILAWVIVLSGAFQAFYGGLMAMSGIEYGFFIEKVHYRGVATGTFVNRNSMAGFLEMSLAVGVGLLLADLQHANTVTFKQKLRHFVGWVLSHKMQIRVLLAIMVIGLVLTHSRMGNTAFFISLLLSGLVWLVLEKKKPKRGVMFLLTTLFIIDVGIVGAWFGIEKVVDRIESTSVESESRDEVVRDSLLYLNDYAWFGSGGGTFEYVFPQYRGADIISDYDYAHNDYIQFAVETGVLGLSMLGLLVLLTMWRSIQMMRKGERSLHRGLSFASFMGVLAILIHSTVDFNLQMPANALLFMVLLSFPWLGCYRSQNKQYMRESAL